MQAAVHRHAVEGSRGRGRHRRTRDDTTAAAAALKKTWPRTQRSAAQTAINYFTRPAGGDGEEMRGRRRRPCRRARGKWQQSAGPHGGSRPPPSGFRPGV